MDSNALPMGLMTLIKAGTRELVLAAGGPEEVKRLIGASDGQISRWRGDAYPDVIPSWAIAALEFRTQAPIFATMFASLTGHRVVPVEADGAGGPGADLIGDLVGVTQHGAQVSSALGAALSDGKVTPGEARTVMAAIGGLEQRLTGAKQRLAVVVGGR